MAEKATSNINPIIFHIHNYDDDSLRFHCAKSECVRELYICDFLLNL